MTPLPDDFLFSQSSLQDYVDCARRFQLRYLMQVRYPAVLAEPLLEFERQTALGEAFHQLVHQHLIGIPSERITESITDDRLIRWWQHYLKFGLKDLPSEVLLPEMKLFARIGNYRVVAKYDLLTLSSDNRCVIVDWKTSPRKPNRAALMSKLQTIIYRYVLVESGHILNGNKPIPADQVEMIYWFSEYPNESIKIAYSDEEHLKAEQYLKTLLSEISTNDVFPLTEERRHCLYCQYRSLCERGVAAGSLAEYEQEEGRDAEISLDFDFDQVAEVEF